MSTTMIIIIIKTGVQRINCSYYILFYLQTVRQTCNLSLYLQICTNMSSFPNSNYNHII